MPHADWQIHWRGYVARGETLKEAKEKLQVKIDYAANTTRETLVEQNKALTELTIPARIGKH